MQSIAIIGGGLSGLYVARELQKHYNVTLFEARERLGGRIHTVDGFDLGPSWVWPHQRRILTLIHSLGLEVFRQYETGYALYQTHEGVQRFTAPPSSPSGRIIGGIGRLIERLSDQLFATDLRIGETVTSVHFSGSGLNLHTTRHDYRFDRVLITLPPRLALQSIVFDPPLLPDVQRQMERIPTWMGHSAKCVIEFETPFWREMGLSGFGFSHTGPIGELHDACTAERYALFGFLRSDADMDRIETLIEKQLRHLFGENLPRIIGFHCVDWRKEPFTAVEADAKPLAAHPAYGLNLTHCEENIRFIGTETSAIEGGYLEGALASVEPLLHDLIPGHQ